MKVQFKCIMLQFGITILVFPQKSWVFSISSTICQKRLTELEKQGNIATYY